MLAKKHKVNYQEGMALLTALIFISVSVLVVIALMGRYTQQRLHVDRFEDYYLVFEAAEAAQQQCLAELDQGEDGIIGLEGWEPDFDEQENLVLPDFDAEGVVPATLESMPGIEFIGYTHAWFGDGRDSNGDGVVDDLSEFGMFSIHTAARGNGHLRQIECVYSSNDVNIWNNAIFGGTGQAGRLINGNVSIHGSVHLLGEDLPPGATAIEGTEPPDAMELSGTSIIANNYFGMPAELRQRIPNPPTRLYNGQQVETLNTKVRVKRGRVGINGNAHIGNAQVSGSGRKGPVDGTYVTDGWTGNQVTNDGGRGIPNPARYYSDNGHTQTYDLGNRVRMPYLNHDWREPNGSRVMNPNTGTWYTHEEYFTEVLLANPNNRTDGIFNGNITLNARNQTSNAVYWNATTQTYLTGSDAIAATPGPNDDYIKFTPSNALLQMNGQIRINGNLTFTGQGNARRINYSGRAAFLVAGNIQIDTDLVSCNNGNPNNIANSFPQNNIIGLMAKRTNANTGKIMIGGDSQMQIMGAFYAENLISSAFQTQIIGTMVGNYFSMGNQVPSIYYVPSLRHNLPYGMISNYPIVVLSRESWRELGI